MIATQPAKEVIPMTIEENATVETQGICWGPYTLGNGKWEAVAGCNVIAVWKGENRAYTGILYKPGDAPESITFSDLDVYTKDELIEDFYGQNIWNLADDEVAHYFSFYSTVTVGETAQEALDNFYDLYGTDWAQDILNDPYWQEILLWRLEVIS